MKKLLNFAVMIIIAISGICTQTTASAQNSRYSQRTRDSYSSSHHSTTFRTQSDVYAYLSGKVFSDGKVSLRITGDAVYANGNAISAAPIVSEITSTSALIRANSPYLGGQGFSLFLNAASGTIRCLESGEKFYLK